MVTYAEKTGHKRINWLKELSKVRKRSDLNELSNSWETCAVGNTDSSIIRYRNGQPVNHNLAHFGRAFGAAVIRKDWISALVFYYAITDLSKELSLPVEQKVM